ncbi:hypothetical protein GCM10010401_16420 [Rarobacter faecitabidus]
MGAGAAIVLAAIGLAPAAQAATVEISGGTLQWSVSNQVVQHLSARTVAGSALIKNATAGVVAFGNATGTVDDASGEATIQYSGSYTAGFVYGGSTLYSVTITDPVVEVEADGSGNLSATVSSDVAPAHQSSQGLPTAPTAGVKIVEFTGAAVAVANGIASFTATPKFENVLVPGSQEASDLGLAAEHPYGGQSFRPEFLKAIAKGIRAHFLATADPAVGQAANEKKRPTIIVGAGPVLTTGVTLAEGGATLDVKGTGFRAVTNQGDAGVYLGVAPAGGLPDVSSPAGMANFVTAAYIPAVPSSVVTKSISIPAGDIQPLVCYSLYSWQAHSHSNTSQDVELPVSLVPAQPVAITTQPADAVATDGDSAAYEVEVSGSCPSYQWQSSSDGATWANVDGATTASFATPATTLGDNGTKFRVVVAGTAGNEVTSDVASLTVNPRPVSINTNPANAAVVEGETASFAVAAVGSTLTYQWQSSADGQAWTDVAGATAATYTTPSTTLADSGQKLRVVVSGASGQQTSTAATLTVTAKPIVKVLPTVSVTVPAFAYGKQGKASVVVTATGATPTGTVTLTAGAKNLGSAALVNGRVAITIPAKALLPGVTEIKTAYSGDAAVEAGTATSKASVTKAASTVKGKIAKKSIKAKKASALKVTVKSAAGVSVKGTVTVTWKGTKGKAKGKTITKKGTVKANGTVTVKSAKLKKKGTYTVTVSYAGNATVAGAKKAKAAKVVVK